MYARKIIALSLTVSLLAPNFAFAQAIKYEDAVNLADLVEPRIRSLQISLRDYDASTFGTLGNSLGLQSDLIFTKNNEVIITEFRNEMWRFFRLMDTEDGILKFSKSRCDNEGFDIAWSARAEHVLAAAKYIDDTEEELNAFYDQAIGKWRDRTQTWKGKFDTLLGDAPKDRTVSAEEFEKMSTAQKVAHRFKNARNKALRGYNQDLNKIGTIIVLQQSAVNIFLSEMKHILRENLLPEIGYDAFACQPNSSDARAARYCPIDYLVKGKELTEKVGRTMGLDLLADDAFKTASQSTLVETRRGLRDTLNQLSAGHQELAEREGRSLSKEEHFAKNLGQLPPRIQGLVLNYIEEIEKKAEIAARYIDEYEISIDRNSNETYNNEIMHELLYGGVENDHLDAGVPLFTNVLNKKGTTLNGLSDRLRRHMAQSETADAATDTNENQTASDEQPQTAEPQGTIQVSNRPDTSPDQDDENADNIRTPEVASAEQVEAAIENAAEPLGGIEISSRPDERADDEPTRKTLSDQELADRWKDGGGIESNSVVEAQSKDRSQDRTEGSTKPIEIARATEQPNAVDEISAEEKAAIDKELMAAMIPVLEEVKLVKFELENDIKKFASITPTQQAFDAGGGKCPIASVLVVDVLASASLGCGPLMNVSPGNVINGFGIPEGAVYVDHKTGNVIPPFGPNDKLGLCIAVDFNSATPSAEMLRDEQGRLIAVALSDVGDGSRFSNGFRSESGDDVADMISRLKGVLDGSGIGEDLQEPSFEVEPLPSFGGGPQFVGPNSGETFGGGEPQFVGPNSGQISTGDESRFIGPN